jgi:membrane protein
MDTGLKDHRSTPAAPAVRITGLDSVTGPPPETLDAGVLASRGLPEGFLANALHQLRVRAWPTLKYLTQTDVHTFAFSVAANAILSFFPFIVLLMTVVRRVFHSQRMYEVILRLLQAYLPTSQEAQDFIVKNLDKLARAHRGIQLVSLVMLLVTSTGVFLPLEVALNQVWGFKKNRSYIGNQLISLALAFGCGVLALGSVAMTASNQVLLQHAFFGHTNNFFFDRISRVVMKFFAILASIAIYFLIYWILPHGKVKARWVLPAAVTAGLLQEVAKYAYILALPRLDFKEVYGPFHISISLMFWAFISGLLLLGGAHLSAAGRVQGEPLPVNDVAQSGRTFQLYDRG